MQEYYHYQQKLIESMLVNHPQRLSLLDGLIGFLSFFGPKSFWRRTYYGLLKQVDRLKQEGQGVKALQMLIHALKRNYYWSDHANKWWHIMRTSIMLAQDLQLNASENTCEPIHQLMKLSINAPQPWQGFTVAYCFASLSLWSFESGKINRAIHQVKLAINADASWGYSEYLLGWYGLHFEGIDSVAHFVKAIKSNWLFFQRLKQDPLCQKFPQILQEVRKYILTPTMPISS